MFRSPEHLFLIILISWFLTGCQIGNAVTLTPSDNSELVLTAATATVSVEPTETTKAWTPTPEQSLTSTPLLTTSSAPAQIATLLPPACEKPPSDISVDPWWQLLTKDYEGKGCKLPALAPDGVFLAYVSLAHQENEQGDYFVDSVRISNTGRDKKEKEVYSAHKMDHISTLEWSSTGQLIFGESIWEGPRVIFVYDPLKDTILTKMRALQDDKLRWNPQHTIFYAWHTGGYGADSCVGELGGYDFQSGNPFPDLYRVFKVAETEDDPFCIPYGKHDNLYIEPFGWSQDGKRLWLTVTPLHWKGNDAYEYEVEPRQVGVLEFSTTEIKYKSLAADPHYDYSFEGQTDPKIVSKFYQLSLCP
jgi:hypothetical protein